MDIDPAEWQRHQRYLLAVAYRLLGSVTDAEDAVQESYLRLRRDDVTGVAELRAWLTTVVSRICLDQLRSARVQRETYIGPWLPEPQLGADAGPDPADRVTSPSLCRLPCSLCWKHSRQRSAPRSSSTTCSGSVSSRSPTS